MVRGNSLKLLVGVAAFSWAGLCFAGRSGFPTLRKVKIDRAEGTVASVKKDVAVSLKGRVRQDWLGYDKIYTLRASDDDQLSGSRTKACVDFLASYGEEKYGKSAADAKLRLSNYGFWKREAFYTPFRLSYDKSNVETMNLLTYVEEAWVNLHFGVFFKAFDNWYSMEKHPISVKIGYFPYQLGRGISFGDFPMHIPYLGFDSYGYDDTRYNHPGILIHGNINKDISYDLYYTKQDEISLSRSMTWETINSNRTDGHRQWRGISRDRELWAARMDLKSMRSWGDLHVQPYGMYLDAPELKLEVIGDSNARLGTVGCMMEYKKGRFSVNAEAATQFGHCNVYAIDRNEEVVETDPNAVGGKYGIQTAYYTHIFTQPTNGTKVAAGGNVATYHDTYYNKGGYDPINKQWIPAVTKNGDAILNDAFSPIGSAYNSDVTGNARFRDGYRIDYRGFMGVVDMMYEFEEVPVKICGAAAYISGDKYPFNSERNKKYRAFIPYGDYNYVGKYVYSQIILEARKLPRPVDISYHDQYAHNNVKDCSNLAYLGVGAKWHPFKDEKEKLMLQTNVLWYWETATLKKWDKDAELPSDFGGRESGEPWETYNSVWYKGEHRVGWKSCDDASRELGTELNFEAQYRPVNNCIFLAQIACLIPGQLYKDLDGQPNERTIDGPQAYIGNFGLGSDPVWRVAFSLDYRF